MRTRLTSQHKKYWERRQINWQQDYSSTWNHPHRAVILRMIEAMRVPVQSILELGCASGPNLFYFRSKYPGLQVGGIDLNKEAIAVAKKTFPPNSVFDVGSVDNTYFADKSADIVISDMCFIYLGRKAFRAALAEARRVAAKGVVFTEFHHKNVFVRLGLWFASGYYAYDYQKELELAGFHDIRMHKLTEQDWPGGSPQREFGWSISARV